MINVNSIDLSPYGRVKQIKRNILPPSELSLVDIKGSPGLLLLFKKHGAREIVVTFQIKGTDNTDLQSIAEDLAFVLDSDDVVPITFTDEPGRTYYGIYTGSIEKDDISHRHATVEITFLCPDPYKYAGETTLSVPADGRITVDPGGTVKTYPTLEFVADNAVTFVSCVAPDGHVILGSPATIEDTKVEEWEKVFDDDMATTTGWTTGSTVADNATPAGTIGSDGDNFYATDYSTGSGWHGPAVKKSISNPVQDFKMQAWFFFRSTVDEVGRAEVYLLDDSNNVVCKVALKELSINQEQTIGELRAGPWGGPGKAMINSAGSSNPYVWNDFEGYLEIERIGNKWSASVIGYKDGKYYGRMSNKTWIDEDNEVMNPITQVNVHFGQSGTHPVTHTMKVRRVRVYKYNAPGSNQIPYIAEAGDVITVNTHNGEILRNGIPTPWMYNPATKWFALEPGTTDLAFEPSADITAEIRYKGRWK